MADFKYLGITTYVQNTPKTHEKFVILCSAIDALQSQVPTIPVDAQAYEDVVQSEGFVYLYEHDSLCYGESFEMPNNTPEEYMTPKIELMNVKENELIRLYIPTVSKNEDDLQNFLNNGLLPVLSDLFGSELVSIKTRSGIEYEDFSEGKDEVVLSAKETQKAQ